MKFQLVMVVWGEAYTETMLKATIPMLLSPGNVPALSNLSSSDITFYTRPEDEKKIRDAPVVKHLQDLLALRFAYIDPSREKSKYNAMAEAQWTAALRARAEGAHCLMLGPDFLLADGSLATVNHFAAAGKRAVMSYGPRLKQEVTLQVLENIKRDDLSIAISSRQLVQLALDHMHPETSSAFVDSDRFPRAPSFCMWSMKQGILLRGFHLHPIMIDFSDPSSIRNLDNLRTVTTDGHFIGQTISRWSDIHVETDSDNFFMCSLHPANSRLPAISRLPTQETIRGMAYHPWMNPLHRSFFMQAIRMHAGNLDESWDAIEEESARWAYDALTIGRNTAGARVISELVVSEWSKKRERLLRKCLKPARALMRIKAPPPG
jgi:hypothetical protein